MHGRCYRRESHRVRGVSRVSSAGAAYSLLEAGTLPNPFAALMPDDRKTQSRGLAGRTASSLFLPPGLDLTPEPSPVPVGRKGSLSEVLGVGSPSRCATLCALCLPSMAASPLILPFTIRFAVNRERDRQLRRPSSMQELRTLHGLGTPPSSASPKGSTASPMARLKGRPQSSPLSTTSNTLRQKMMKSRFALDHHVVGKNHPIRHHRTPPSQPVELAPLGSLGDIASEWGFLEAEKPEVPEHQVTRARLGGG